MKVEDIQLALREAGVDGWLFYDHHHRDPIAGRMLGLDPKALVTRRWYYLVPAEGEPRKLVHRIESGRLDGVPGRAGVYSSWQELEAGLGAMLMPFQRIAMQYSPRNAIMYVSMVDAGTVELLRAMGKTIVSSADLVSHFEAVLTEEQRASHYRAGRLVDGILEEGFREVGRRVRAGWKGPGGATSGSSAATEFGMVVWFREAMARAGLVWEHGPNVSVGAHSSDSHYEASEVGSAAIREGDFLLVDIWAREAGGLKDGAGSCWYDITWTGVIGRAASAREAEVFGVVAAARDAAVAAVSGAFAAGRPMAGWEADDAARGVVAAAGFGEYFTHRTGHNIATELHGNGAHLDNLETHDERRLLPYTCFSVEPGIYLPEFGVRSEVNVMTSASGAEVTGRVQRELVRI